MRQLKCCHCADPAQQWDSRGRMVCEVCYRETEEGIVTNQNINFFVGRTQDDRKDHPEWDMVIRSVEDQIGLDFRM